MAVRRASRNYVNLGNLYSIPQHVLMRPFSPVEPNMVNLGNLYTPSKDKRPPGWAYFDDGSVFILPYGWFSHDAFEARMKIAAHFVNGPTPKMQKMRRENVHRKRFIIINKDGRELRENTLHMLARNAQEGQRLTAVDHPFENVELSLDHTGSQPISARFNDAPQLSYAHRLRNAEALETFRGTLVNGMLQPNVRLGNGLRLSIKANILKPQITKKRRARNHEAKELREIVGLPPRAPAKLLDRLGVSRDRPLPQRLDKPPPATTPPLPRRPAPRRDHDLERREAQIAQRERELIQLQQQLLLQTMRTQNDRPRRERAPRSPPRDSHYTREYRTPTPTRAHRDTDADSNATVIDAREKALAQEEELLRYKRKAWLLEQKLAAQATGRPTPRRERYQRDRYQQDANVQNQGSQYPDWPPPGHEAVPDPQHGGSSDEFPSGEFDLDDSSPPKALETLRSRIQLPDRSTMRSNRTPRQR